jgi:hypothetical protein
MPISSNDRYKDIKLKIFPLPRHPPPRPSHPDNDHNDKDHFMAMACLASLRSKDPTRQVNIKLMRSYLYTSWQSQSNLHVYSGIRSLLQIKLNEKILYIIQLFYCTATA